MEVEYDGLIVAVAIAKTTSSDHVGGAEINDADDFDTEETALRADDGVAQDVRFERLVGVADVLGLVGEKRVGDGGGLDERDAECAAVNVAIMSARDSTLGVLA